MKKSAKKPRRKVGRPPELTKELSVEIRELVLTGMSYIKIQKHLGIPDGTWDGWVRLDYHGFRVALMTYNHEYMLKLAQQNMLENLKMETIEPVIGMFGPIFDKKTKKPILRQNDKLLRIKNDTNIFVSETLGKKYYTKKVETEDVTKKRLIILKDGGGKNNI